MRLRRLALLAAIVAALGLGAWFAVNELALSRQRGRLAALESAVARLTAERPLLRFMVLESGRGSILVRLRPLDLDGREGEAIEERIPGSELALDFLVAPVSAPAAAAGGKSGGGGSAQTSWMAIPYRLFSEALAPAEGPRIHARLERDGYPACYEGGALGEREREAIAALYAELLAAWEGEGGPAPGREAAAAAPIPRGAFGSAVHEIAGLARFEVGVAYRAVLRSGGGIEIVEEAP